MTATQVTVSVHVEAGATIKSDTYAENEFRPAFACVELGEWPGRSILILNDAEAVERLIEAFDQAHAFLSAGVDGKCPRCGRDADRCAEDDLCGEKAEAAT